MKTMRNQARSLREKVSASVRSESEAFFDTWEVRRRIYDFRAAKGATFEGTAIVTPDKFEEAGSLNLGETTTRATRAYQLEFAAERVVVRFPDGSEFIELSAAAKQSVVHLCGEDRYRGRFFFVDADHWVEAWRVVGPRKCYASVSHYRRVLAAR